MAFLATMNSTLQLNSSDEMRGRVMALYFVLFMGSTPIGAPIVGWVAEAFSPRAALAFGGIVTIGACLYGVLKLPAALVADEKPGVEREADLLEAADVERLAPPGPLPTEAEIGDASSDGRGRSDPIRARE